LWYPDSSRDEKGYNPIIYPDLTFKYKVRTEAIGNSIKLSVDLEKPLPDEWADKIGFNLELFPGQFFGEHYLMDTKPGLFPRQANGPTFYDNENNLQSTPLAIGKELIVAPGKVGKEIKFISNKNDLHLIDGRGIYTNSWFILRSNISGGATKNAVEWTITPNVDPNWKYKPVIQVSQIGYHPEQKKFAVVELDKSINNFDTIQLIKINSDSGEIVKEDDQPSVWGNFLRYKYLRFDFSDVMGEGIYKIKYDNVESNEFEIKKNIYARDIWQPSLEYFLPVQMCHMRIEDRYKVWHGLCHMDDALMAPTNHNHFDGYFQPGSTFTKYKSGEHVPGINIGGWHDAGDYDLRVESQAGTVYKLALAYEFFPNDYDETTINQETRVVELHKPDGKPDILQQIEHGVLSIVGGYESMGRLYRGIISPTLKQYVHLGDAATISDNLIYNENKTDPVLKKPLPKDDRWIFTEENPQRELYVAQVLAAAYRVLKEFNPELSGKCLKIAEELFENTTIEKGNFREEGNKINAAAELYLSTSKKEYENFILQSEDMIKSNIIYFADAIGRVVKKIDNPEFSEAIESSIKNTYSKITEMQKENPYGVPYKPRIWGAGWDIQSFGVKQLFLHLGFPEIFSSEYVFNALNFVLGVHPGENTSSFVSGVGVKSLTVAYGVNRDEWSY
ncbi:MAG: glycoside hydrolase family 9 protein, partial [Ignavibacteriaceae bacterium]